MMLGHIDCNNFYCSCERLFQPKLKNKPVVVLSNNDGCAIARSEEAKALGIEMGMPYHLFKNIIDQYQINVFSSNYTLYGDISERVMQIIQSHVPRMECYSIDEAFLDFSQMQGQQAFELATRIRMQVRIETDIPISIGIAPTKTLAKMANRYAKKERRQLGVYMVESDKGRIELLNYTGIGDVWGIGRQHEAKLKQQGIHTAWDLLNMNDNWMRNNLTVIGQRLLNELKGISCVPLEEEVSGKEAICTSRSFGKLLTELNDIKVAVANYASQCALKLRKQKACAGVVQVFVQTNSFRKQDGQYYNAIPITLPVATNNTQEIIFYAISGLNMIFRNGYNYMKAGVIVTGLVPENKVQQSMFDTRDRFKEKFVVESMDRINKSYGVNLVKFAAQCGKTNWHMNRNFLSPCYTTRLRDVRKIYI